MVIRCEFLEILQSEKNLWNNSSGNSEEIKICRRSARAYLTPRRVEIVPIEIRAVIVSSMSSHSMESEPKRLDRWVCWSLHSNTFRTEILWYWFVSKFWESLAQKSGLQTSERHWNSSKLIITSIIPSKYHHRTHLQPDFGAKNRSNWTWGFTESLDSNMPISRLELVGSQKKLQRKSVSWPQIFRNLFCSQ